MTCMARWLDIGQVTVLGQHAAILTKQAWSVKNLLSFVAKRNFFSLSRWSWLGKIGLQSQLWFNDIILHLLFYLTGTCTLNVVAMALSGYTEEKKTLWRDMCRSLCGQVSWCRTTFKTQNNSLLLMLLDAVLLDCMFNSVLYSNSLPWDGVMRISLESIVLWRLNSQLWLMCNKSSKIQSMWRLKDTIVLALYLSAERCCLS